MTTETFALSLHQFSINTEHKMKNACKKIGMELWSRIIEKSPVGNPDLWLSPYARSWAIRTGYKGGRFRANWGVSIGTPYTGYNSDILDTTPTGQRGGAAISRAISATRGWDIRLPIYMTNNAPYAAVLEFDGHSTQAPMGMVRITVAEMENGGAEAVLT